MNNPIFIAEIKTQSPFGFRSKDTFVDLMDIAITHGDWISVHTNALWGGDFDAISFVRRNTNKTILAKGIHASDDDVKRAIDHGADYVLVVDRTGVPYANKFRKQVIHEMHDPHFALPDKNGRTELDCLIRRFHDIGSVLDPHSVPIKYHPDKNPIKYLVNSRNLGTGLPKENYDKELTAYINSGVWVCQGSGIKSPVDVNANVNAYIVGEHLRDFCKEITSNEITK